MRDHPDPAQEPQQAPDRVPPKSWRDIDLEDGAPAGAISGRAVTHAPYGVAPGDTLGHGGTDPDDEERRG
jgi:hypothetical protein